MIQRRCPKCNEWSTDSEHCNFCGELISSERIAEIRDEERKMQMKAKSRDQFDSWLEHNINALEHSPYFLIRTMFKVVYSIWFTVMAVGSFVAYIAIWLVG